MADTTFGFIGFGLIGGSIAKSIRRSCPEARIMAYMRSRSKLEQAKQDGVVDLILDEPGSQLGQCDIIFLCTPVEYNAGYLEAIRPFLKEGALITDVGSMVQVAKLSDAIPIVLDYREHDRIVAAISHLPHLIASSLVNLVRDSDNTQELMKRLAAGGFKDITRIASSSPEMWEQICMTNTENIILMMKDYISSLQDILSALENRNGSYVHQLFDSSRTYRNSISEGVRGSVIPDYSFTVDVVDEPGAISTLACILSARGISMSNIGINHNREHGEGALRITFYDEASMNQAWAQLKKYNYELIKGV